MIFTSSALDRNSWLRKICKPLAASLTLTSLITVPVLADLEKPRTPIHEQRIEDRYAEHLEILRLSDADAVLRLDDFLHLPASALRHATLGDLYSEEDWQQTVRIDLALDTGISNTESAQTRLFAQRHPLELRPSLAMPFPDYLASMGLSLDPQNHRGEHSGVHRVSRVSSFEVELTLNGETSRYSAIALWAQDGKNESVRLRILDQVLRIDDYRNGGISLASSTDFSFVGDSSAMPKAIQSGNAATIVSHTIPTQMSCGESALVSVTMGNAGTNSWSQNLCYKLGAYQDSDPFFDYNPRWDVPTKSSVDTSEQITFLFNLRAPDTEGTYTTDWRMISQVSCGGLGWFGPVVAQDVEVTCEDDPEIYDAVEFISDTFPEEMACGEETTAFITVRNSGFSLWSPDFGHALTTHDYEAFLPDGPWEYPVTPSGGSPGTQPGDFEGFTINLKAPDLPGSYTSSWRMWGNDSFFGIRYTKRIDVVCQLGELEVRDPDGNVITNNSVYDMPGGVPFGETADLDFSICNTGAEDLGISPKGGPIYVSGGGFTGYQDPAPWVAPNTCTTIGARFTSTVPGEFQGTLQFYSTDREEPFTLTLQTHTGPSDLRVTDAAGNILNDGDTLSLHGVAAQETLTLCAFGPSPIQIDNPNSLIVDSGPSGAFTQVGAPAADLDYPECTSFDVRFTSAGQNESGALEIRSDALEPVIRINLLGYT